MFPRSILGQQRFLSSCCALPARLEVRILPAWELINSKGGLSNLDLFFYPETYQVNAYGKRRLIKELLGWPGDMGPVPEGRWPGNMGPVTVGPLPAILFGISSRVSFQKSLAWSILLLLFAVLSLAHNAPIDLLRILSELPVFSSLHNAEKYFGFQIVFTLAIGAGQFFWLLTKLRRKWLEHVCASALILGGLAFLAPTFFRIHRDTYTFKTPSEYLVRRDFFNIQGQNLPRNRKEPLRSVTYLNLIQNVGTLDWFTGVPIGENARPKYYVDRRGNLISNADYRGEAFFGEGSGEIESFSLTPNSISAAVETSAPAVLVVNQNYHRDWRADQGELFEVDGLLALRLPEAGSHRISLRYLPRSFFLGLAIRYLAVWRAFYLFA